MSRSHIPKLQHHRLALKGLTGNVAVTAQY